MYIKLKLIMEDNKDNNIRQEGTLEDDIIIENRDISKKILLILRRKPRQLFKTDI